MTMGGRKKRRDERGAALVEFALILPILTMMLFGIVQFGIAYDQKQSMNSAAREGARFGGLPTTQVDAAGSNDDIIGRTEGAYQSFGADPNDLTITVENEDGDVYSGSDMPCDDGVHDGPNERVVVVVEKDFEVGIPLLGPQTAHMESRGEFRCEDPAP